MGQPLHRFRDGLLRATLFAGIWIILTGADPASWLLGGLTVGAATATSLLTSPDAWRLPRIRPMFRYLWYFLLQSVLAGVDVARRVFSPSLPLQPDLIKIETKLPSPGRREVKAGTLNLLPGTLTVTDDPPGTLNVHVLDRRMPSQAVADQLEQRLAALLPNEET